MHGTTGQLLIVNLFLQLFDGLASYHILSAGVPEANPLVAFFIGHWGLFSGLLYSKFFACALVLFVFMLRHKASRIVTQGLTVLAGLYSCLGFVLLLHIVWFIS